MYYIIQNIPYINATPRYIRSIKKSRGGVFTDDLYTSRIQYALRFNTKQEASWWAGKFDTIIETYSVSSVE